MSYSQGFKINVNKLNAEESLLILLEITHPFVATPIRLVNDSKDFVLNDNLFIHMPFEVKRQNDVQGELPKVSLSITNVGRSLIRWIEASGGGRDAKLKVMLCRRSSQNIEESIEFGIQSVVATTQKISFNLVIQNNLVKRSIRWVYDKRHARGLF